MIGEPPQRPQRIPSTISTAGAPAAITGGSVWGPIGKVHVANLQSQIVVYPSDISLRTRRGHESFTRLVHRSAHDSGPTRDSPAAILPNPVREVTGSRAASSRNAANRTFCGLTAMGQKSPVRLAFLQSGWGAAIDVISSSGAGFALTCRYRTDKTRPLQDRR